MSTSKKSGRKSYEDDFVDANPSDAEEEILENVENDETNIKKKKKPKSRTKKKEVREQQAEPKKSSDTKKKTEIKTNKLIEVKTSDVSALKTLSEILKEFLQDVNIEFKQDKEMNERDYNDDDDTNVSRFTEKSSDVDSKKENGHIKISAMDPTKSVIILVTLNAKKFDVFRISKPICDVGISVVDFYKQIKHLDSSDILTIEIDEYDKHKLILHVENEKNKTDEKSILQTLDMDKRQYNLSTEIFEIIVTMEAAEFHRICKIMASVGQNVEIICSGDYITFTCKNGNNVEKTIRKNVAGKIKTADDKKVIVQGIFDLRNFTMVAKSSTLCNDVRIYMKNDYIIFIQYAVSSLGKLLIGVVPISSNDVNDNLSDEEDDNPKEQQASTESLGNSLENLNLDDQDEQEEQDEHEEAVRADISY